jgi:hypothetical protein
VPPDRGHAQPAQVVPLPAITATAVDVSDGVRGLASALEGLTRAVGAEHLPLSVQPLERCHGSSHPRACVMAEREHYGQQTPSVSLSVASNNAPSVGSGWWSP